MLSKRFTLNVLGLLTVCQILLLATWILAMEQKELERRLRPSEQRPEQLYHPANGFVPDSLTAIRIAEAVWLPIYGKAVHESVPFEAELMGDTIWSVSGTLSEALTHGGVPYAEIRKSDGRIVGVGHGE